MFDRFMENNLLIKEELRKAEQERRENEMKKEKRERRTKS